MTNLSKKRLLFYNASTAGHALFDQLILFFTFNFFLPPKELVDNGSMIKFIPDNILPYIPVFGFIMVFGRIVDAIADPMVATLSDNSKSKFGRRRIFLLISSLPLSLSTILIFFPPFNYESQLNTLYLCIMFGLFFLFYTMYVAPYIALIPEIATKDDERLSITTVQGFFALAGGAVVTLGGTTLVDLFSDYGLVNAYKIMIIILSVIGFIFLISSVIAVDESKFSKAEPATIPLIESLKLTLTNKYFLIFLGGNMALWYVFNVLRSTAIHVGQTLMGQDIGSTNQNFMVLFIVAGISFVIVMKLADRFGKKPIMISGLISFALFAVFLAFTGHFPFDPELYGIVLFSLMGYPTAVLLVVPNVYISELCDYDYKKTGVHREAMYFGTHGFFLKLNLGLATGISSFFYVTFGKDISNPAGVRYSLIFAGLIALLGIWLFRNYPKMVQTIDNKN
jgi:GPH family glycoside/pentoside/hexuronide:cation symporter